jgi:hypothetical protein
MRGGNLVADLDRAQANSELVLEHMAGLARANAIG